jgi:lysophospholipase L1-like esterase
VSAAAVRHRLATAVLAGLAVVLPACAGEPPETLAVEALPPAFAYVAVGGSETVGAGADDPATEAWTSVLHRDGLSRSATFVNVGERAATVRGALDRQLAPALDEAPRLVTVWLNVADLVRDVPVADYERDLRELVRALRRGGAADVLVAGAPALTDLPVVVDCLPGATGCRLREGLPSAEDLADRVAAYDAAIARVAAAEGAVVVDVRSSTGGGPGSGLVSVDGFHPSSEGHRRLADAFADAVAGLPGAGELVPGAEAQAEVG